MYIVLILSGLGIFSLLSEIFNIRRVIFPIVIAGLTGAGLVAVLDWNASTSYYNDMLLFDNYALSFSAAINGVAILWFIMCRKYLQKNTHITDHFALLLFALTGAVFMVSYHNLVMLFLGIETLSVSLYVLAGSRMKDILSNEAAYKYFLMGAFATGFLLFGISLVYGATGSFHLAQIQATVVSGNFEFGILLYAGVLMILAGLAFKISAVPFHFWAPDVYQGAPTVITAFMSTIVKIAAFAALFRLFATCFGAIAQKWIDVAMVITVLTLLVSNISAVYQQDVKRMLAWSSVAHAGYLLITLVTMNEDSPGIILYYVSAYSFATIGAFCVVHCLTGNDKNATIEDFNGLAKENSFLAVAMTISLLSLAGIPPLAGFFAKYMIFSQAVLKGYAGLLILGIGTSLIGVYYYFRIILAMFLKDGNSEKISFPASTRFLLIIVTLFSILLGLFPDLLDVV